MSSPSPFQVHLEPWADATSLNAQLEAGYRRLRDDPAIGRSHWFAGRYENLYVPVDRLPALGDLVTAAVARAARITARAPASLRCRYWFNAMGPGQHTGLHSHDEDDEILSGVYYVRAPGGSGDLVLRPAAGSPRRVPPREGRFVFFPPQIPHEVEINRSGRLRLSIGMNFGPEG